MTVQCYSKEFMMAKCDPRKGVYLISARIYRGKVSPKEVNKTKETIQKLKSVKEVCWSNIKYKCGISLKQPNYIENGDKAVCMVANHTAIN